MPAIFASGLPSLTTGASILSESSNSPSTLSISTLSSLGSGLSTSSTRQGIAASTPSSNGMNSLGAAGGIIPPSLGSIVSTALTVPSGQLQSGNLNGVTITPTRLPAGQGNGIPTLANIEPISLVDTVGVGNILASVVSIAVADITPILANPLQPLGGTGNLVPSGNLDDQVTNGNVVPIINGVTNGALGNIPTAVGILQGNGVPQGNTGTGLSGLGGFKNVIVEGSDPDISIPADGAIISMEGFPFNGKESAERIHISSIDTIPEANGIPNTVTIVVSRTVIPLPASDTLQSSTTFLPTVRNHPLATLGGENLGGGDVLRRESSMKMVKQIVQDFMKFCEENPEDSVCREE